ncbi:hypothetical protein [uncultured Pelagimonas sp.]|uniref:hypothetical protein n=1 Tax=uncultured Pelagimonas sp. TaxID=1618102 RepID=UPI0026270516|nr:hypothetical protein [uncultured Pelagimonas sp.]
MQMIAVDAAALDRLHDKIDRLEQKLDAAHITPPPKWITVAEYAKRVGKTEGTVRRWIREGSLERKDKLVANPDV